MIHASVPGGRLWTTPLTRCCQITLLPSGRLVNWPATDGDVPVITAVGEGADEVPVVLAVDGAGADVVDDAGADVLVGLLELHAANATAVAVTHSTDMQRGRSSFFGIGFTLPGRWGGLRSGEPPGHETKKLQEDRDRPESGDNVDCLLAASGEQLQVNSDGPGGEHSVVAD